MAVEIVSVQPETVYPDKKSGVPEEKDPLVQTMERRLVEALGQVPHTITTPSARIEAAQQIVLDQLNKERAERRRQEQETLRKSIEPPLASGVLDRETKIKAIREFAQNSSQRAKTHNLPSPRRLR